MGEGMEQIERNYKRVYNKDKNVIDAANERL